jgi:hypothetical protein
MTEQCACKKRVLPADTTKIVTVDGTRHTRHECSPFEGPESKWAKRSNAADFCDSPLADERQSQPERGNDSDAPSRWLQKETEFAVHVMRKDADMMLRKLVVEEFDRRETKELVLSLCGFPFPDMFERLARGMADAFGKQFGGGYPGWDGHNMAAKKAWIAAAKTVYAIKVEKS